MLYKKTLLQSIAILSLLSGCAVGGLSLYKEPIDGPKARLRIESEDYYTLKTGNYGTSAAYVRPHHPQSHGQMLLFIPPGYVASYGGKNSFVNKANKNEKSYLGVSLNIPGKFKESMSDVYIPANTPVEVSYIFHRQSSLSTVSQCGFSFTFIPEENKDYYAYFQYNPATKKCSTSKLMDITGKEPLMVQTLEPKEPPTFLERKPKSKE